MSRKLLHNELRVEKTNEGWRYELQSPQHIFITMKLNTICKGMEYRWRPWEDDGMIPRVL